MPSLHVSLPDGSDATHELTEDLITVGRVSDNLLQIDDASVSSHHAELQQHDGTYILTDLGSTNGTQVNGRPVAPETTATLRHGDTVIFGHITTQFLTEAGADAAPMPEGHEPALEVATTAVAPTDFSNASPFPKRTTEKDKAGTAVMALGVVSLLAAFAAIFFIFQMKSPF